MNADTEPPMTPNPRSRESRPDAAQSRCPKCKSPEAARIVHTYEFGGAQRDDSYCGRCGASWPKPVAATTTPR
jgi:hypothetical protein